MPTAPLVIVLNGGSSSGKSTLARCLQVELEGFWLRWGIDDFIDAAPPRLMGGDGLDLGADGSVAVGEQFVTVESHWQAGIAAIARHGGQVIVEDNFVSGVPAQRRWSTALRDVETRWVGVHCASEVAAAREAARGDRVPGMAAQQAVSVHEGIHYDLRVDTGVATPQELARHIQQQLFGRHH